MEWQKVFYEFLIVTVPAVILYFIGWGYLYYYFGAFGINIAEAHFDVPTIFIYSVPVVQNAIAHSVWYLAGAFVTLPFLLLIIFRLLKPRLKYKVKQKWLPVVAAVDGMPVWAKLLFVIVALALSALALRPIIEEAALETARRIWSGPATYVIALPEPKGDSQSKPAESSPWREQYADCSKHEALRLIYADDSAYYLLCMNEEDKSGQGVIFEIRRKEGLVSVRFAERG